MATWQEKWLPEDKEFWEKTGKKIAWRTLWITTLSLILSFASWFMMSAIVVKLPGIGFKFTENQLFWLAAMPGLAGGLLRILHTFLLPKFGTRHVITLSTFAKLLPVIGIGLAVMNTTTPFWVFMMLAFTAGFGGGDFSSFMPSTSVHFPKRLQGTALGIQAGIGNFGVSLAQFMTPVMLGLAIYGSAEVFTSFDAKEVTASIQATDSTSLAHHSAIFSAQDPAIQEKLIKAADAKKVDSLKTAGFADNAAIFAHLPAKMKTKAITSLNPKVAEKVIKGINPAAKGVKNKEIHVQSAAFWYAPLLLIMGIVAWIWLRSVPMKASFKEQLDIFKDKHTWFCTITYVMTFGSFAGLAAVFPMMIKSLYGGFEGAPEPLVYAFYGPLIGSASRVLFGFVADKVGGAILTTLSGIGLIVGCVLLVALGLVAPTNVGQFDMFLWVMLGMFFFTGIGNAATFRQYPIVFGHNPRQAAGVIGWTAAVAAFGPFLFNLAIGNIIKASGTVPGEKSAAPFFYGLIAFAILATVINWYYYQRKGAERPC
ncbi:MAG: MFS transporter [Bacteroidetes bacterium]|nr:MFS transporter [Bacteroidota bacterium]